MGPGYIEDAPMDAGDQDLMDDVSVNLAEVISGKLQNCRMGLSSSVDLDTDPKGPGIFLILSSPQICCQPLTYISRSSWLTALLWKSAKGVAESLSRTLVTEVLQQELRQHDSLAPLETKTS